MQDLQKCVTEEQATWLRLLESLEYDGVGDPIEIPDDVIDALLEMGFVRRWHDGTIAITLGGVKEVAQH